MRVKALLIIAHGSRNQLANVEIAKLAGQLEQQSQEGIEFVEHAFLELAEPLIPDGIRRCVEKGAATILVVPYFLNTGIHVAKDIPAIIEESRQSHPGIDVQLLPHIGASIEQMQGFITQLIHDNAQ